MSTESGFCYVCKKKYDPRLMISHRCPDCRRGRIVEAKGGYEISPWTVEGQRIWKQVGGQGPQGGRRWAKRAVVLSVAEAKVRLDKLKRMSVSAD